MPAGDKWGNYSKIRCPECNSKIHYFVFEPDDSYSPGSSGRFCTNKKCNRKFTIKEIIDLKAKALNEQHNKNSKQ